MKILITLLCLLLVTSCAKQSSFNKGFANSYSSLTTSNTQLEYSKDTLIIFFDAKIGKQYLLEAIKKTNAEIIYHYTMMNGIAVKINKHDNLEQYMNDFKKIKGVLSVEKDYTIIKN